MSDRMTTHAAPKTLVEGQRFDQPTFHAIYEAMPPGTRAELIDGVVHMPGPVGLEHGEAQVPVIEWLGYYAENTHGVRAMDNATTILGWKSEPQPDGLLRILPECGGRTWNAGGYVHGGSRARRRGHKGNPRSAPWMPSASCLFGADGQNEGTVQSETIDRCSSCRRQPHQRNTGPPEMVDPALAAGVKERHGAPRFWVSSRSS